MKRVLLFSLTTLPILLVANTAYASGGAGFGYTVNLGFSFGVSPGFPGGYGYGYGSASAMATLARPTSAVLAAYYNGPLYNYGYGPYNQAMLGAGYPYPLGGAEMFYGNGNGHGFGGAYGGGCADGQCLPSFPRLFHGGPGLFSRVRGLFHHGLFHHGHCHHGCHGLPADTTGFGGVPASGGTIIGGCNGCGSGSPVISSSQYPSMPAANATQPPAPTVNPLVMPLAPAGYHFAPPASAGQAGFNFGR
jgi:hypothetical protein